MNQNLIKKIIKEDSFIKNFPSIDKIEFIKGGVTHYVFKITIEGINYYLKIRDKRFAFIPEISCDPNDIYYEYKALLILNKLFPKNFPKVLSFNKNKHYLVLSDVIFNGNRMEDLFLMKKITAKILFNFGKTLSNIHNKINNFKKPLRGKIKEKKYYLKLLNHRFGYKKNCLLLDLIKFLAEHKEKQLIIGDVSPKNIGVNNNGELLTFFDLENVHQGDVIFDYGYFIGHILIHSLYSSKIALLNLNSYIQGYNKKIFNDLIVKKIALGTMLYRLNSIIPYKTDLNFNQKRILENKINFVLSKKIENNLSWSKIVLSLSYE